jgi:hypothetical protein
MEARFDIETLLRRAPIVTCPGCLVEMTMRDLAAVPEVDAIVSATYRCPNCGTDTKREFVATP